ncbi:sensor histidine kinase [Corynebacterium jeikeium]|uniref:sensor histidine kinase n=1 Tax=Corynebacterium jeikeium TaxID=38289 RepID=UPI000884222B|nr:HAMP domain-containing sensor histidine kinase [Corynebacterium jeikeium]SCX20969.1 Signal transduction histidine-protein kinase/phosphatase MprB [Corynebacterium jeikeium]
MILRRLPEDYLAVEPEHTPAENGGADSRKESRRDRLIQSLRFSVRGLSLRTRLAALTAIVVMLCIAIITVSSYATVKQVLSQEMDKTLQTQAQAYIDSDFEFPVSETGEGEDYRPRFFDSDNNMSVLIVPAEQAGRRADVRKFEGILNPDEISVLVGDEPYTFESEGDKRSFAIGALDGRVIVLRLDIAFTNQTLESLWLVLILIAVTGFIASIIAGIAVANSGIQPITRLRRAADEVSRTGELRQIPVYSHDELGSLTDSFNNMMNALQNAQTKQKNLVADASHELKTPLTSLRTNIELLMLASQRKDGEGPGISEEDRKDLERDVIAQIDEMSGLIGDLVDLAREDSNPEVLTTVEVSELINLGIERVQRRRPDVTFDAHLIEWHLRGDSFALSRALLNLLDNAAKWSPEGGVVRVWMQPIVSEEGDAAGPDTEVSVHQEVEIRVADSGPGIPKEDREKVFDRFYRSIQARSMPGSGLGLAIVKQVIERHHGVIVADESDDGGALMRAVLPGEPS